MYQYFESLPLDNYERFNKYISDSPDTKEKEKIKKILDLYNLLKLINPELNLLNVNPFAHSNEISPAEPAAEPEAEPEAEAETEAEPAAEPVAEPAAEPEPQVEAESEALDCTKSEVQPGMLTKYLTNDFEETFTTHIKKFIACALNISLDSLSVLKEANNNSRLKKIVGLFDKKLGRADGNKLFVHIKNPNMNKIDSKKEWNVSSLGLKKFTFIVKHSRENEFLIFIASGQQFSEIGPDSIFNPPKEGGGKRNRTRKNTEQIGGAVGDEYIFNFGFRVTKPPEGQTPLSNAVQKVRLSRGGPTSPQTKKGGKRRRRNTKKSN
jgi:hypothetical protein